MLWIYLAVGGVAGTLARHSMGMWVHSWAGAWLPWGTFAVNLLGTFILGFAIRAAVALPISAELRGMVTVGFCGAFTTFSTLMFETSVLLQEGEWERAALYASGSLACGLLAMGLGFAAATLTFGTAG